MSLSIIAKEINGPSWGPKKNKLILMNFKRKLIKDENKTFVDKSH